MVWGQAFENKVAYPEIRCAAKMRTLSMAARFKLSQKQPEGEDEDEYHNA